MASFRTILPAPERKAGEESLDDGSSTSSPVSSQRKLLKRIRSVPQACQMCRQMKAKCDGGRPRCGNCIDRNRPCGYEGEAGQSLQAAMRARLAALESIYTALRTASPVETERLLQRLRTTDDPVSLHREDGGSPSSASTSTTSALQPSSTTGVVGITTITPRRTSPGVSPRISPRQSTSVGSGREMSVSPPNSTDQLSNINTRSNSTSPIVVELFFPDYLTTLKAVAEFYMNRGKLFHVFSEEETNRFCDIAFERSATTSAGTATEDDRNIALSCLAGVAAVGMQFSPESFMPSAINDVYSIAKQNFELIMDKSPFLATKLAALLAMFNIMNRNTMALIWIGVGLRLSRKSGLANKTPSDPNISLTEWIKHRRTWRTLVFLSCWLAFTMCSITGQEVEYEKTNPAAMELETYPDIGEILQTEFAKISILKVEILRIYLTFKKITVLSFESVMRDLQSWHDKLPPQIHLANVHDTVLSAEAQKSVYYLHLLYMGAILLVYRRMASQYNDALNANAGQRILTEGLEAIPTTLLRQGIQAARASAQVCAVLLQNQAMSKRSWIVIIQAYASCIVLLHIVAQKRVHGCRWETWQGDLQRAEICLQILNFHSSATVDDAAREFYATLFPMFLELSRAPSPPFAGHQAMAGFLQGDENYESVALLWTIPAHTPPERTRIPLELMSMLGQPFRKPSGAASLALDEATPIESSNYELPQLSGLGWSMESHLTAAQDPRG